MTALTTYLVPEEPSAGFKEHLMGALEKHAFKHIDIDAGKDRSTGWVAYDDTGCVDLTWDRVFLDPYVAVTLREDAIRIPPGAFRDALERRSRQFLAEKGRTKLDKAERTAIKQDVLSQLRRRAIPDVQTFKVWWDTTKGTLTLETANRRIRETFEDLVQNTWGVRILPVCPYTCAAEGEDLERAAALLDLEPVDIPGMGVAA